MYGEWQREKEDLLESIRMLQEQMQLKDMVVEAFIPPEEVQKVGEGWQGKGEGSREAVVKRGREREEGREW